MWTGWMPQAPRFRTHIGAEYVRRWRITAVAADEPEAIAIDVCVFSIRLTTCEIRTIAPTHASPPCRVRQP